MYKDRIEDKAQVELQRISKLHKQVIKQVDESHMQASKDQTSLCKYAAFAACIHKIRNAFKISCHNLSTQYQKICT